MKYKSKITHMRLVTVTETCLYLYFPNKMAIHNRQMICVINIEYKYRISIIQII